MNRLISALLVFFHLVSLWPVAAFAVPIAPIIYSAYRIGTNAYAVSQLAELGQSLVGSLLKETVVSTSPLTAAQLEAGAYSGVRIPNTSAEAVSAPVADLTAPLTSTGGGDPVAPVNSTNWCSSHALSGAFRYCGVNTFGSPTKAEECAAAGYSGVSNNGGCIDQIGFLGTVSISTCPADYSLSGSICNPPPVVNSCPSGYVLSGSTCNLSNARMASPDGKVDQERVGQGFQTYAGEEPSIFDDFLSRSTINSTNDRITISGRDAVTSQPQTVSVTNTPDGGSVIRVSTQKTDALGRTYTDVRDVAINPSGVVTSVQGSQQAIQNTWNTTTNTYTESPSPTSTYTPVTSSPEIVFPSNYAKAGEAALAASSINSNLGPKLDKITETGADPNDPTIPGQEEFNQAFFSGTFTDLLGWSLPAHSSACPTSSFDWNNSTYLVDSHCQLIEDHFSAFSTVMTVIWSILALFILLAA